MTATRSRDARKILRQLVDRSQFELGFKLLLEADCSLHQPQQAIAKEPTCGTKKQFHPALSPRGIGNNNNNYRDCIWKNIKS